MKENRFEPRYPLMGTLHRDIPVPIRRRCGRRGGWVWALAVVLSGLVAAPTTSAAGKDEWVPLFDGKTLNGWKQINGSARYEVKDGAIVGMSVPRSPNSFLCTTRDYADFELEFEVQVDAALNSGVQIRSQSRPDYQDGRVHGYQVEIAVDGFSGGIYDESRRNKFLNSEPVTAEIRGLLKAGTWNKYRVVCRGDHIQTWVNGVAVTDLHDGMTPSGFIGLQVHGVGDRQDPLFVRWRAIRLRELTAGP